MPALLEQASKRGVDRLAGLLVCGDRVNARGRDILVAEGLLHYGQVNVAGDEGKSERMFEAVRVPSVGGEARALRDRLESAKELRAVNPSALQRDKKSTQARRPRCSRCSIMFPKS